MKPVKHNEWKAKVITALKQFFKMLAASAAKEIVQIIIDALFN